MENSRVETVEIRPGLSLEFCYVPPGVFTMGSAPDEPGHEDDETQVTITISEGFWLGRVPVTQKVWGAIFSTQGSGAPDLPAVSMGWYSCYGFMSRLNRCVELDGAEWRFDLPTEAQWEYACRAGSLGPYAAANFWHGEEHPNPVGQFTGNALGLQDMHGNVFEWCADWYGEYPAGSTTDPGGPDSGEQRVFRGGAFNSPASSCRAAKRSAVEPDRRSKQLGFRLALVPVSSQNKRDISRIVAQFIFDYWNDKGYQSRKNDDYAWDCLLLEVYLKNSERSTFQNGAEVGDISVKVVDLYPSFGDMKSDHGCTLINYINDACAGAGVESICICDRNSYGDYDYYKSEF
jgi:sulfatase modifying factor 1